MRSRAEGKPEPCAQCGRVWEVRGGYWTDVSVGVPPCSKCGGGGGVATVKAKPGPCPKHAPHTLYECHDCVPATRPVGGYPWD